MPLIRYEVTLPAQARAHPTAFAPVPVSTVAFFSKSRAQGWTVCGQPGTRRIPAPYADTGVLSGPGTALPGGAGGAGAAGSRYMPAAWYPNLYYARQQLSGSIGGVRAGWLVNARPGPAGHPTRTAQAVPATVQPGMRPRRARWLGRRQVAADPVTPTYPRWGRRG